MHYLDALDSNFMSKKSLERLHRKPRRGRPPRADGAATERIEIRVTRIERFAWSHAAAQAGLTLSEWLRTLANAAAG